MSDTEATPLFVMGAGRSGTNLLGHILEADPRYWNNYECRYVWNYGQKDLSHDVRRSCDLTAAQRDYIRRYFARLSAQHGKIVVDKTPSNVFRVGFIHGVFPDARIIHMIRDGRDNIVSRRAKWLQQGKDDASAERSSQHTASLGKQVEHFRTLIARGNLPWDRLPVFVVDNTLPLVKQVLTGKAQRWAERFPGMSQSLRVYGELPTAAIQWREGVMRALADGRALPAENYLEVRYERLLREPVDEWCRIAEFLGIDADGPALEFITANINRSNAGKWKQALTAQDLAAIEPHIRPTLEFLGYGWEDAADPATAPESAVDGPS